jgi:uncharacterized protein (TIGR03067 family)
MKRIAFILLFLSPMAAAAQEDKDPVAKDLKQMQGAWTMVRLEVNGTDVPLAKLDGTELTIKDDKYIVAVKDKKIVCTIVLDPKHDPKHLNMVFAEGEKKDKTHKAIYRFDGDKLQIARGLNAEQDRPNQFATWPDTNYFVVTWRRK